MDDIELLKRQLDRERRARKEAERLLEDKAMELYQANQRLKDLNLNLERQIERRSKELLTSELKYRSMVETLDLGILEVDKNNLILKANDSFCAMIGYSHDELVGANANELFVSPAYQSKLVQETTHRQTGSSGVYEVELIRKNGERIWVLINGTPLYNEKGEVYGSLGVHYDLTKQKKLNMELERARREAESAKDAEKQFLANMSHEIRTPLNAIIGMSQLLYDSGIDETQKGFLDTLKGAADILKALISDILDFSKIQSGRLQIQQEPFDLRQVINNLVKTFEYRMRQKGLNFSIDLSPACDSRVKGDELLLNQVLLNLLSNAEKFTEQGKVELRVETEEISEDRIQFLFSVSDTGIGISRKDLKHIFEIYRRGYNVRKKIAESTGLGLAIAKQLVDMQDGEMWVESELGEGTTFYFRLGYQNLGRSQQRVRSNGQPQIRNWNRPVKVLIAEDNLLNQKYIGALLRRWNIEHRIVDDGRALLSVIDEERYDVILLDIRMPFMNGYEVARAVRSDDSINHSTPIMALTASALRSEKEKVFSVGMNAFLAKPYTPDQLYQSIQDLLERDREQQMPVPDASADPSGSINFDREFLVDLYQGDSEHMLEVFQLFRDYSLPDFLSLEQLIETESWEEVSRISHRVKAAFGMVGFPQLQPQLDELEQAARENLPVHEMMKKYGNLKEKVQIVTEKINEELQALSEGRSEFIV